VTPTFTKTNTPRTFLDLPRDPLVRPGAGVPERLASARPVGTPAPKWGLPEPVAVVAMAGGGAVQFGLAALLVPATPTPTPWPTDPASGLPIAGCHSWRYTLHWDRPSRLATLKNALGNSVTINKSYKGPAGAVNGQLGDWPDPMTASVDWNGSPNPGAWNYKSPPASAGVTAAYDHDCDDFANGGPACGAGEHPGIWYADGYADATGLIVAAADPQGEIVDWSWTLNYGYGKAPNDDIIYGLDPGPPLLAYDMTVDTAGTGSSGLGGSIPGITGTPLTLTNALNQAGTTQAQPTWQVLAPSDVVGLTHNQVNWGLMTYQDQSALPPSGDPHVLAGWCTDDAANYHLLVPIVSDDSGDVSAIEAYLKLKYYDSNPCTTPSASNCPGLAASGGTPTKRAIKLAGDSLYDSWTSDPKKQCARPWGVILCTDGLSNTCNTGSGTVDQVWEPFDYYGTATSNAPCEADIAGSDYLNYPPSEAETLYNRAFEFGSGDVIRPRTYAIGIAPEVGRCELNRIAYRGRSDARAARGDAGFLLYDTSVSASSCALIGDADLPHITTSPNPSPPPTTLQTDENGPTPDRLRQDNGGLGPYDPTKPDYAFFALDTNSIVNAFLTIVASTASGDYSTSAPVSGGAIAQGSIVLLPSTDYPPWTGHLRAIDTSGASPVIKWDAADVLNDPQQPWQPEPTASVSHPGRAIYTWDPGTGTLIPVDTAAADVLAMKALAGGDPNFTANVVDWVRGNDGTLTNTKRFVKGASTCDSTGWLLGPLINSTPAVVGGPYQYKQFGNVADHRPFEATYAARRPLAWIGSDDGMMHAFDFADGTEVLALLPPDQLENQVALYKNFVAGQPTNDNVTGQSKLIDQHIWGVANSFRFTDIFFAGGYKTVGFITEGPGGNTVAAVDITHVFPGYSSASPVVPADPNYDSANPVTVLWTKNATNYPGLYGSWSVPAVAADSFSTSRMFFGAGINPASLLTASVDATAFVVDPKDGTLNASLTLAQQGTPTPLVGQQSFADGVFFQTKAPGYLPDNVADLNLQADLNGQVWYDWGAFTGSPSSAVGIDLNSASGTTNVTTVNGDGTITVTSGAAGAASPQPIYYSPAATGQGTSGCQIYALASGSLYETSPTVSGWNVNRTGAPPAPYDGALPAFTPYLYIGVGPWKLTDPSFGVAPIGKDPNQQYVVKQRIGGEVPDAIPLPVGDPLLATGQTKLGVRTQVTSGPLLIVDNTGIQSEKAIFLLYDPDAGCNGTSYVVILTFQSGPTCSAPAITPPAGSPSGTTGIEALGAGPGAASGITLTDKKLFAARSGIGRDASATLTEVPVDVNTLSGIPTFVPVWWRDVK